MTCAAIADQLTDQACNAQWLWPTFQGYVVAVIALTFVGCVVAVVVDWVVRHYRDARTDRLMRRDMRSAWRRGMLKERDL
jgi:heme O synthase-like polyprenyltransferase